MIPLAPGSSIFVVNEAVSFACRLNGMLGICRDVLAIEPMDGAYIVFRNRKGTMIRVIFYDGDGFWLCEKRFSQGSIRHWCGRGGVITSVTARELGVLLWRGNPAGAGFPSLWKKLA